MKAAYLLLFLGCIPAYAQDAGIWYTWFAQQEANYANQVAFQMMVETSQQAYQQAMQASPRACNQAMPYNPHFVGITRQPVFSVKPGTVAPGTTVRIKSPTHDAVIYYTTDGWTPTVHSRRYQGPIVINGTTDLQAIAIAPRRARSVMARANYTVQGSMLTIPPLALPANGLLARGTRLLVAATGAVNSRTAQVGDPIPMVLDQDINAGDAILAPKGTPVQATITIANSAEIIGTPGDLAFAVRSFTIHGTVVPLSGGDFLMGADHSKKLTALAFIPVAGVAAFPMRGDEAQIQPGMTFTAVVATDTRLQP